MRNKLISYILIAMLFSVFTGCGSSSSSDDISDSSTSSTESTDTTDSTDDTDDTESTDSSSMEITEYLVNNSVYTATSTASTSDIATLLDDNKSSHEEDGDYTYESSEVSEIALNDVSTTISSAGVYKISGTISDGQLIVEAGDDDIVKLILDGIDITSSTSAPIFITNASKVIIFLEEDSINTLADSSSNEEKGTLLSKTDLSITGTGTLEITSNLNDALRSNDGLIIKSGIFNITSADDTIRGKDYLIIEDGTFTLDAVGDALKSDNEDDEDRGYIYISGGEFDIKSESDGLQAQSDLLISGGIFDIETAGGSELIISDDVSAKALKSNLNIILDGGIFSIDSADDAIHSDDSIVINAGEYSIASSDDAIHSEVSLEINGGEFDITKSYEGLESALITINNGYIDITASDDAINVAGDSNSSIYELYINGGFTIIDSDGDGLDANGYIYMSDGVVIVNGPTSSANSAIDYDKTFDISGGVMVAVGSSNMANTGSSSSTQKSILVKFNSTLSANSLITLKNSSNEILVTFEASKNFQSLAFSSEDITNDTYSLYTGGSVVGTSYSGIYKNPVYTAGTLSKTFTVSSTVTTVR